MAEDVERFDDSLASQQNELIVATEHEGFIRDHLAGFIDDVFVSQPLGLTKFTVQTGNAAHSLDGLVRAEDRVRRIRDAMHAQAAASLTVAVSTRSAEDSIGAIVRDLRALAAAHHGGWVPTIGRNRFVEFPGVGATGVTSYGVHARALSGAGVTSYGGGGVPRPVSRLRGWTPPPPRASGPGRGVRVGLVDTRLWPHPWLAGGWHAGPSSLTTAEGAPPLAAGHGTFVSGQILSQAPGATLDVRAVLDGQGQGTAWDAAVAIAELGRSGVAVINASFTCHTADGQPPLVLARAIDRVDSDTVVVAAAGNHAGLGSRDKVHEDPLAAFSSLPSWPAALDDVVAVGSLDRGGRPAPFSPDRPWVDVLAPGVDLRSTYLPYASGQGSGLRFGSGWADWSGTSFSAALVSGAIASAVDPGRVSAAQAWSDLLASASGVDEAGAKLAGSAPRRLPLWTGWAARRSNRSR